MPLTTPKGTQYLSFNTTTGGDRVRAFAPIRLPREVTVVWLIHGYGSSHDAILGGFNSTALALVDAGCVVVCPNLGGSLWSSPRAQNYLKAHHVEVTRQIAGYRAKITRQIMVGTSHGACLATYATGKNLIPNIKGLYVINGVYDAYNRDGGYGAGMRLSYMLAGGTVATNPPSIPASAFTAPVRIVYDTTDPTVNARGNSILFRDRLKAAGRPFSTRVHNSEHSTPAGTPADLVAFVRTAAAD